MRQWGIETCEARAATEIHAVGKGWYEVHMLTGEKVKDGAG